MNLKYVAKSILAPCGNNLSLSQRTEVGMFLPLPGHINLIEHHTGGGYAHLPLPFELINQRGSAHFYSTLDLPVILAEPLNPKVPRKKSGCSTAIPSPTCLQSLTGPCSTPVALPHEGCVKITLLSGTLTI